MNNYIIQWQVLLSRLSYLCSICLLQQQPALWSFLHSSECSSSCYSHLVSIPPFHYCHICSFVSKLVTFPLTHFYTHSIQQIVLLSCKWVRLQREEPCKLLPHMNVSVLRCVREPSPSSSWRSFIPTHRTTKARSFCMLSITLTVPFQFHLWLLWAQILCPCRLRPSGSDAPCKQPLHGPSLRDEADTSSLLLSAFSCMPALHGSRP